MSKWAMRAHLRHLRFNKFSIIKIILQGNEFWPLQLHSENSGVLLGLQLPTWEFTWECEGSFPHTLCTPRSMWSDSRVSFLAHHLLTPCFVHEPKARVATTYITGVHYFHSPYFNVVESYTFFCFLGCNSCKLT